MEKSVQAELGEKFLRDNHFMRRDSWPEEIDPLRSTNESHRWSEVGDNFQRDSPQILQGENHPGDMDHIERDSLSDDDDDQPIKHARDSQSLFANGATLSCERDGELMRHSLRGYERESVMPQDYALHYEVSSRPTDKAYPIRGGYEQDREHTMSYDRISVDRAHTMKDFEKQITELKKENFNLKLRIYFLEEQVQRHCDNSSEELHRMNIELKVEVESLKHEFQEKQNLLIRASKAMESLAGEHNFSVQQMKDDHLKHLQDLEDVHQQKIQLLEDQIKQEKAELEKICVLMDQERMQRFNAEERLLAVKEQYNKSMGILEERDWIVQCLNETLCSKDVLIAQLEKQIKTMLPSDSTSTKSVSLLPEGCLSPGFTSRDGHLSPGLVHREGRSSSPGITCRDCLATKSSEEGETFNNWQNKVKEMGNVIKELQQKLEDNKAGLAIEEQNSLKRDKAIQGLTVALKKKTKENEKLLKEIDNLNAALAEARKPSQHEQSQNLRKTIDPNYEKLILTIHAQQDLCSRLHDYERESGNLQKEFDAILMLRKWLEKDIQSNQELRKVLEAQIMAKYRESDTMSFLGDQTSYLSICLDHLDQNTNFVDGSAEALNRPQVTSVETQTSLTGEILHSLQDGKSELIEDMKDKSAAAVAIDPRGMFTKYSQSTASSSTQTESKGYVNKSILVDMDALRKQTGDVNEAKEILCDSVSHQCTTDVCETQNDKQQKCLSNNHIKSRIPVLLKSYLSKQTKTDTCLTSVENEHVCLEKELQEENEKLLEQLRCAELEIGALKSSIADPKGAPSVLGDFDNAEIVSSGLFIHENLQPERLNIPSEKHICTQIEAEQNQLDKAAEKHPPLLSDLQKPDKHDTDSSHFAEQLQLGIDELSEKVQYAQSENENTPSRDVKSQITNTDLVTDNSITAEINLFAEPVQKKLQLENLRLAEQLKCAQMDIEKLQACEVNSLYKDLQLENLRLTEQLKCAQVDIEKLQACEVNSLYKDLQLENLQLAEQLKCAQVDIEKLRGSEVNSLHKDLQLENLRLTEQLKRAQVDIEKLQACEVNSLHKDLQLEKLQLAEQLKCAQVDIEKLRASEVNSLHKDLQLKNLRLSEQLKCAQIDIEKLQACEVNFKSRTPVSDLESAYTLERDLAMQSMIEELQLENQRLVEQLKCSQDEIEKLQEEKVIDITSRFKLDNIDREDRDSEHSFLDKTITNPISLSEIHNGIPDFEVQVNSRNLTCQNIAGLCCHHDRFCIACANNQETLIFQSSSFKKISTIQKECKLLTVSHSHKPFEDASLSKYDLLVQSQARELSHQRQKIKESHNLSVVCSKNFINVIKAFEELLLTNGLDSNIALGFQEQLAQTVEWMKEMEYKLSDAYYGEDDANSDHSADSLLYTPSRLVPGHKMWADKHGCHVLGLVEDYNALRKQILEAKSVLEETESFLDHGVQTAVLNMTEHFGNVFFEKLNRTKQSLEEASCLLKLLWRVSLPLQAHSSYSVRQVEETNLEMTRLRKRVLEQEKLLSGMVKRVYSETQMKEDIEKLILNQLAMTHDILKRAKGNLEVQVVEKH